MASKVSGLIEYIKPGGPNATQHAIASTAYGYCTTIANEPAKTVEMTGFKLNEGTTIHIKFQYANTAGSPTLNVNSTGAKAVAFGTMNADTDGTIGWRADDIVEFTYDGTSWVVNNSAYATRAGSVLANNVKPIATKTYNMNLYNSSTGANFYQTFATVTPVNYNEMWIASYRITITASGHLDYTEISYVSISGRANTYYSYYIYNSLINYPIYYHTYLPSSSASTPHELGYRMASSYGATDVQKVAKVELLEQTNCTVTLLDSLKLYTSSVPSGYYTWYNFNATSNGLQESGDANDTAYYFLTNGFKGKVGANKIYRYCLFARTSDGSYESFVMQDNTRATTKTVNPHGFVPDGKIYWNANNTVYSQGTLNFSPYEQYHVIDYLYSFNFDNQFLPDYCETYIVWTYNSTDGLLYLNTTQWLAAGLPTTADGKIYQRIGSKYYTGTSNYYQGSLLLDNPYYEYKNGAIHEWNGRAADAGTVNGHTVAIDVPSNAKFTDTTSFTITAAATDGLWDLTGTNGTNKVTYALAPFSAKQSAASFYTAATNPTLTTRLNYDGYLYATKLYSGGSEVLTSHRTYTAVSGKKPTGNQTPSFGSTFDIEQVGQDATGQVSVTERTVTIPNTSASASVAGLVDTSAQEFAGIKTFRNGIEIKGHIAGDSSTTGHGLYSGGGYHNAYNNIILHGDASTGSSGIAFISDKINTSTGAVTTINQPSDRAFIQYHACGITTTTAEGTAPTLATSGEAGRLVIGIGNDSGDKILLQAPGDTDIVHQKGATGYPIPHTTNTNGSVGGTTTPVYVEAGVIKAGDALGGAAYKAADYYAVASHGTHVSYGTSTAKIGTASAGSATTVSRSDHVHAIDLATGDSNGQVKIAGSNVNVKGLASAAYTASTDYSYKHLTDYNFTDTQPLSKYVTFDKNKPVGAPEEVWYNGFISSHSNYHASYIINSHSDWKKWYVGHNVWQEANSPHATAPTWYLLAHSGNVTTGDASGQIKIAGINVTVKDIGASAYHADSYFALASHGNHVPTTQTANNITFLRNDNSWYKLTKTEVNTLINLLDTGSSDLTANDYVITQYVGGGTTTTTYHRRPASKVVNATLVKAALGTVATTAKKFLKDTGSWVQVDWGDLTGKPSTFAPSAHDHNRLTGIGRKTTAATIAYNPSVDNGCRLSWLIYDSTSRNNDATNSPSFDASVINLPWDWGGFNGQIAISSTIKDDTRLQIRSATSVDNGESANPRYTPNYGAWREVVTATKATKVGDTNKPIYISATGQATAISYTIEKSVPSDAKFTDKYHKTGSWGGTNNLTYTATAVNSADALAFTLPTASTSAYGVTKLSAAANDAGLAATAKSVYDLSTTVTGLLAAADAMIFKGTIDGTNGSDADGSTNRKTLPATHNAGWTYRVKKEGTYAGKYCEIGTLIICVKDGTAAADADWTSVETNEDGSVISSSTDPTDNAVVRYDGTTGRIIQKSGITIDDSNNMTIGGTIYFGGNTSSGKSILGFSSTYPKYGIWYKDDTNDIMSFSSSGNADSGISADLGIQSGKIYNKGNIMPHTGNNTGSVGGTTTPVYVDGGQIKACTAYANASVNYATSAGKATNDSDGNAINTTYLKKSGGTMSGQIKTSFKSSIALGSYGSTQTTIEGLIGEVKLSSGCMGSVSIGTAYTLNNVTIPTGWYNFEYIPHRSGGVDGAASGDNCQYGVLHLHRMNGSEYQDYVVSFSNDAIKAVQVVSRFYSTITDGQVLISDGTLGRIKTSGYTIAKSVPSNAVFTDTWNALSTSQAGYVSQAPNDTTKFLRGDANWAVPPNTTYTIATGDSNGQIKVTPSGGTAYNVSVKGLGSAAYTASTDYSYKHLTDYNFTETQPLSKYVTFDKNKPTGAPKEEWYNGFISSHSNYHASYIINGHTHMNEWYVGHNLWHENDTPKAAAPTWYLLAHSGNITTGDANGQVKIAGVNISVKGLGSAAYTSSTDYAAYSHTHNASDINEGILNTARLPDDVVKKRTSLATTTVELDLFKLNPGMYDHTTNPNNLLPTSYGTILNIHGLYKYGALIAAETNNVLYYRAYYYDTDDSYQWRGNWQMVAHANYGTAVGNATTPIYISNTGVVTAGTAIGASAYHADSYFALASHGNHVPSSGTTAQFLRGDNTWSDTLVGPLYINNSTDAEGTNDVGALIIGTKTSTNIAIDDNEIMARNNKATSTLYVNNNGGLVQIGSGGLSTSGKITSTLVGVAAQFGNNSVLEVVDNATASSRKVNIKGKLNLCRSSDNSYGRISYYADSYYTWFTYMSNVGNGLAPTGGKPGVLGDVTSWAMRSLIEQNSGHGWIWESATNAAATANTVETKVRMSLSSYTGKLRIAPDASNTNNESAGLIIDSAKNGSSGNVAIELWRGNNASWQIANESGTLYFRNNYTTAKQSTYTQTSVSIAYNTGNATFAGSVTATGGFSGALSGNATSATKANITSNKYGVAYYSDTAGTFATTEQGTSGYVLQAGGSTAAPSWINATNSNTGSTIVKRDSNGDFSARTITASLTGNATSATKANLTTTQYAIARYSATDGTFANSTTTIDDTGNVTIKGKLRVNPSYDTSNSYNEGIRINQASNGWANIHFGGAKDTTSGNAAEAWLVGRRGAAGTYGAVGDFTIEENGSSGLGLTLHKSKGGATLYTSKTGSSTCFKIINAGTVAATTWLYGLEILSASMAANSNASISIGQAASSKNRAYLGFHYAGSSSDSNYLMLGLYGVNDVFKLYGNKQIEITTDTDASSTTTGALKIAGGAGIAKKLYVGTEVRSPKYIVDEHVTLQWNSTDSSLDFIFA